MIDVISNIIPVIDYILLKHYFCGAFRHRYVVSVKCSVGTVLPLFDRHGEFLEGLVVIPSFPENACQLPCKCPLVSISREERDGLAPLATATCHQGWSSIFSRK